MSTTCCGTWGKGWMRLNEIELDWREIEGKTDGRLWKAPENVGPSSQSYSFFSSHVWMWELAYKESWAPKNECFELWCWKRLLRIPWTAWRPNQPILKEIIPEYSLEGLMLKLKLQNFWPPDVKHWLIVKDPDTGKDWRKEKGTTEDEMVGWHHWISGHEFEQAPGSDDRQGSLMCCSPWGRKESDTTERLHFHFQVTHRVI